MDFFFFSFLLFVVSEIYRYINATVHTKHSSFVLFFLSRTYPDHSRWKLRNCYKDRRNIGRKRATRETRLNKKDAEVKIVHRDRHRIREWNLERDKIAKERRTTRFYAVVKRCLRT